MSQHKKRRRSHTGFSLVEISVVLALISTMLGGAMMFYQNAVIATRYKEVTEEILMIRQVISGLYHGQSGYVGLTESQIVSTGQLPAKWVLGTSQGTPWHSYGYIREEAVVMGQGTGIIIGFHYVPAHVCVKMLTTSPGVDGQWAAAGGGTGYLSLLGETVPFATAELICGASGNVDVAYIGG